MPRRISDIPALGAARAPDDEALREEDRAWSFADLERATADGARRLTAAGVRGGDRVLVVGENCAALVALLFAIARLDAWPVLVNARLSAREIDAIQAHCEPRRAIYLADVSPEARAHANRHGAMEPLTVCGIAEVRLGALATAVQPEPVTEDPAAQVAALLYTSGTTGDPKGVMLTHRNLLFIARVSSTLRKLGPGDRVYGVLPIAHVYGLASVCLGTLFAGACLQLEPRYSPQAMALALDRLGITVVQGVPAMYVKLLEHLRANGQAMAAPRLRFVYAGGSPLEPALKAEVERQFGLTLHNGYGLTEASPTVTQTRLEAPRTDCSVGTALPGVALRIVDIGGLTVPVGTPGELLVRGPNVMLGYFRNAQATAQAIDADGWLRTGDLARQEADGALFIVGRTRELIIRSGFNVHPAEVEGVLNAHPAVLQCAVVGRPAAGNEEVVAFVELVPGGAATGAELARFAAQHLAPYKRPAEIVILPLLPVSAAGKILKHQLRLQAAARGTTAAPAGEHR
ncbi:MAG: AMP-binding protein [Casimicrobiaceae bacterium]